ncbi:MAG: hypothetical protein AAF211_10080 [Myxococcota bacterium]
MVGWVWLVACEPVEMVSPEGPVDEPLPAVEDPDADDDGLSDADEASRGTDPQDADTDDDRLPDGVEVLETDTDPLVPDSDGDGYLDGDEVAEASDPNDPEDRIYTGGWPYFFDKDALVDPGFAGPPAVAVGRRFGRFVGIDRFSERVDLYDFAMQGRYVVVSGIGTGDWCGPCELASEWLSGGFDGAALEVRYGEVRAAVDAGTLSWISVVVRGTSITQAGNVNDAVAWHGRYPNDRIAVLADPDDVIEDAVNRESLSEIVIPTYVVLDESMRVVVRGGIEEVLEELTRRLAASE